MHTDNYYELLGLSKEATTGEIKKAYRKLSMQYHPDKNPDGEEMFKKISEAYETLIDEEKRKAYDNPPQQRHFRFNFGGGGQHEPNFDDDIFTRFFNRGGGRWRSRGADIRLNLLVKTKDIYLGTTHTIQYKRQVGNQMVMETKTVTIPKGCDHGGVLRMPGGGNAGPDGQPESYGDLYVHVLVEGDGFIKDENHLVCEITIDPVDLLIGKEVIVHHYDGDLKVNIPAGVNPNYFLRVAGKGFPLPFNQGDLLLRLTVEGGVQLPPKLVEELKKFKSGEQKQE